MRCARKPLIFLGRVDQEQFALVPLTEGIPTRGSSGCRDSDAQTQMGPTSELRTTVDHLTSIAQRLAGFYASHHHHHTREELTSNFLEGVVVGVVHNFLTLWRRELLLYPGEVSQQAARAWPSCGFHVRCDCEASGTFMVALRCAMLAINGVDLLSCC